jgi:taspase (threonine aspartase 1)
MAAAPRFALAVHAGAGTHARWKHGALCEVLEDALEAGVAAAAASRDALEAVVAATKVLEDCALTNAGRGACLSLAGTVECDACIMATRPSTPRPLCGAVAAAPELRNPVASAAALALQASRGPLALGRVPPIMLCGDGARSFTAAQRLRDDARVAPPEWLVTREARRRHSRYVSALAAEGLEPAAKRTRSMDAGESKKEGAVAAEEQEEECEDEEAGAKVTRAAPSETVGAVAWVDGGGLAAASSSGGHWLKAAGRVGHAAVPGAGCFASTRAAAASSGCGEELLLESLSRRLCDAAEATDDESGIARLVSAPPSGCGALLLSLHATKGDGDLRQLRLRVLHSAPQFAFGARTSACPAATVAVACVGSAEAARARCAFEGGLRV